jgi:hypothetical protein
MGGAFRLAARVVHYSCREEASSQQRTDMFTRQQLTR